MSGSDIGFMLVATALVFFMTPGLAFFYGGFDSEKNVVNLIFQCFIAIGVGTVLWFTVGHSLSFSGDIGGVVGNLDQVFLKGIKPTDVFEGTQIPVYLFSFFQLMFAVITPALMVGAFTHRMSTVAYLLFITFWLVLIYFPFVHMIWGGGILAEWGVIDFAGGIVVHTLAGFGALAAVIYMGKRKKQETVSHNIPFIALGTGMLWFGWFGFNAGSALAANGIASLALINSQLAAAFGGLVWFSIDLFYSKKCKLVPFCVGSIAGLATITPCAGFVTPPSAAVIGFLGGLMCYCFVGFKNKMGWDDALDVWPVHGMGGCVGAVLLGVYATSGINPEGADGLFYGNGYLLIKQITAVGIAACYSFIVSFVILKVLGKFVDIRVSENIELGGIDKHHHGELAYRSIN